MRLLTRFHLRLYCFPNAGCINLRPRFTLAFLDLPQGLISAKRCDMGQVHVFVHSGGSHSLEIAVDYYKQFPWEPSPAGDLDLQDAKFEKVKDITFDKLLEKLASAPAGGTVLIVCHAHDEF